MVDVSIKSFDELIDMQLVIPEYQRAYTWNEEKIDKMIADFNEFLDLIIDNEQQYYMGAILLHDNNGFNIIDGQQRITSLLLLAIVLQHEITNNYENPISYNNVQSKKRIKQNYDHIKNGYDNNTKLVSKDIFDKLCFTVIVTIDVDNAFTFFDTQNNRGISPSVLVLLKAFNLRCINKNSMQKECALSWDNHERESSFQLAEKSEKLEWLMKIFFYRVRSWRGNKTACFGNYDNFRDSFTINIRKPQSHEYKLFSAISNQKVIDDQFESIVKAKNIGLYDFSVRQPIYQGKGFFEFINHYSKLLDELMEIEVHKEKNFKELLEVHKSGSVYMASFLTLVALTYYDRFREDNFSQFIKLFNNLMAEIRYESSRITKQTLEKKFIRCENDYIEQNILDFICSAFDSQEIITWMKTIDKFSNDSLKNTRKTFNENYNSFWGEIKDANF